MIRTIPQGNLDINNRIACQNASLHSTLNTVVDSRDVFLRNSAANDGVDELVTLTGLVGLDLDLNMTVLALTTEPIMKVAVIVPDEYLGDVIGDLNARRGQIQGMEAMAGTQRVNAFVPLAQMFGYATDLRSKTQGRGQYVMEPSHYEPVPKNIADQIIAGRTKG